MAAWILGFMEEVTRGAPEDVSGMLWRGSGGWGTSFTRVWSGVSPRERRKILQ